MEAIWESNPTVNMLYCFEDGNCFIKHGDAASYAKTTGNTYTVKQRPTNEEEKAMEAEAITEAEVTEVETEEAEIKNKPTKTNKK